MRKKKNETFLFINALEGGGRWGQVRAGERLKAKIADDAKKIKKERKKFSKEIFYPWKKNNLIYLRI